MNIKLRKSAIPLIMVMIILSITSTRMKIAFSSANDGKVDLFTQKEPYSGKGPNLSSDAFSLGEEVQIYALTTYKDSPVANILVAFEILGPRNPVENITSYRIAYTNETGIATISFRIPNLKEKAFGEWKITGNAKIADVVHQDSVKFKVGWIVEITSIKTINQNYAAQDVFTRESYVGIELILRNIAMTLKVAYLTVSIYDSANDPIAYDRLDDFVVSPNETLVSVYFFLQIPKSACLGIATVYVCAYTSSLTLTGFAYCPEVSKQFSIAAQTYYLKVETEPAGVATIQGEGWYQENSNVTLVAPASVIVSTGVRYKFGYWTVDGISQGLDVDSIVIRMDANHTAIASYILQYYLTIKTNPLGITTISGEGWYNKSAKVTANAPMVSGYDFRYWDINDVSQGIGVNPVLVHMDAPKTITAHYTQTAQITYTLNITATTGGTTSPAPGAYNFSGGSTVQVTAIPDANYIFSRWELDNVDVGSANPYIVTMDKNHVLRAVFSPAPMGWFVPDWFYWSLLPILILVIILLIIGFYYRRRKEKAEEAFHSGWTAWYYCYDLRNRRHKL